MLAAAAGAVRAEAGSSSQANLGPDRLVTAYRDEVVVPGSSAGKKKPPKRSRRKAGSPGSNVAKVGDVPPVELETSDHPAARTLKFLWQHTTTAEDRRLLEDLAARRLYKRLLEVPASQLNDQLLQKLRMRVDRERLELQTQVSDQLVRAVRSAIQDQSSERESLIEDNTLTEFESAISVRHAFLIDLPLVGWSASGDEPRFVTDYKRRYFRASGGQSTKEEPTIWKDTVAEMMKRIAVFRVYAEPSVHRIVTRVMKPSGIAGALNEVLPGIQKAVGEHS